MSGTEELIEARLLARGSLSTSNADVRSPILSVSYVDVRSPVLLVRPGFEELDDDWKSSRLGFVKMPVSIVD